MFFIRIVISTYVRIVSWLYHFYLLYVKRIWLLLMQCMPDCTVREACFVCDATSAS
jgi:hypothetical protein